MPSPAPSPLRLYLSLVVAVLFLGLSAIFVGWARAPGPVTSFYRMAIAAGALALPFFRRLRRRGRLPASGVGWATLGGVLFGLDLALWASGVLISGATNPTLLANLSPLWVGLGAMLLFGERLGVPFWTGLLIALAGAFVVMGLDLSASPHAGLGTTLGLLASIFYGAYILVTQRGRRDLDVLSYFWISAVSSAALLLAVSILWGYPLTGYPRATVLSFLALGLLTQSLGYFAMNYALGHLPATVVAPTLLGQPVLTGLLAGPLLGEKISPLQVPGALMVLAGIYWVHRSRPGGQRGNLSRKGKHV